MKILIIEDEITVEEHLTYQLHKIIPSTEVLAVIDSVRTAIDYLNQKTDIQLIFMNIHLAEVSISNFSIISASIFLLYSLQPMINRPLMLLR